jgi:hypothetical protein
MTAFLCRERLIFPLAGDNLNIDGKVYNKGKVAIEA